MTPTQASYTYRSARKNRLRATMDNDKEVTRSSEKINQMVCNPIPTLPLI